MTGVGDASGRSERDGGEDSEGRPRSLLGDDTLDGPVLTSWQTYAPEEAERVLSYFELGRIRRAEEFRRGSRSAPKLKVTSDRGLFLLKRRSIHRHPVERIRFSHALQRELVARDYPVAALVPTTAGETLVCEETHAYELFLFIVGDRFDRTALGAAWAGEALARLHLLGRGTDRTGATAASFHASGVVRTALERLGESLRRADPRSNEGAITALAEGLLDAYMRAVEEIDDLGVRRLPPTIVHGDWHPGNLIFRRGRVAAAIDFDSARVETRATEIANGMLQFSLRGESGLSPLEWPDDLDANRMQGFLHGYLIGAEQPLSLDERTMLPWFMIEAMIAESVVPVANQGTFADLPGLPFMQLVLRKCEWVRGHRKAIAAL